MVTQAPPSVAPSGEEAIHRTVDVEPVPLASGQGGALALEQAYEVDLTLAEIERGNYHRVSRILARRTAAIADEKEGSNRSDSNLPTSNCTTRSRSIGLCGIAFRKRKNSTYSQTRPTEGERLARSFKSAQNYSSAHSARSNPHIAVALMKWPPNTSTPTL